MTTQERTAAIITHLDKKIIKIDLGFDRKITGSYYGDYHIILKNNMYYHYTSYIEDRFGFDYNIMLIENYISNKYISQKRSPTSCHG